MDTFVTVSPADHIVTGIVQHFRNYAYPFSG